MATAMRKMRYAVTSWVQELARIMGTSVAMIERSYGALIEGAGADIARRLGEFETTRDRSSDEVATDGLVVADAYGADAPAVGARREVLVHDGRVVGARGVVGSYVDARGAQRESELVRRRAEDFRKVERGAYGVAEFVDEGLAG